MREKQAFERGAELAGKWISFGRIPANTIAREGRVTLEALLRSCDALEQDERPSPSAQRLLDLRWRLEREGNGAIEQLRHCRQKLPAVSWEGRCARLQLLGEQLGGEPFARNAEELAAFLRGVQSVWPLEEQELELLPAALLLGQLALLRKTMERCRENAPEEDALNGCAAALRVLSRIPWEDLTEELSVLHQSFSADEVYRQMPPEDRSRYRHRAAFLARRAGETEDAWSAALTEQAAEEGRHIGFLLYPPAKERGGWYVLALCVPTAAICCLLWRRTGLVWLPALALLPVSELVRQVVDAAALMLCPRRPVFRLDYPNGLPAEGKTLCVVPAVVTGENCGAELAKALERSYLANRSAGEPVNYGVLADLPDGDAPRDWTRSAGMQRLRKEIEALNRRWGSRFFLFAREQTKAPNEPVWRGWERKRGALMELLALLNGEKSSLTVAAGEKERLMGTAFLLTTDSDTRLGVDAVRRLAGAMLHPLNRPVTDIRTRRVDSGYGLLQPRMTTRLTETEESRFAALFCGDSGSDPYTAGAAELYHDAFDRGSYCGKGMIDVKTGWQCLKGRFPEDRILSHDLLEGAFLRAGYFPEVELADGFPHTVESALRRSHRWVRGDWQAARWVFGPIPREDGTAEPNPLPLIDRWKLLDNLRRSLLPCAELGCLLAGGLGLPAGKILFGLGLAALASPLWMALLRKTLSGFRGGLQRTCEPTLRGLCGTLCRCGAELMLLPCRSVNNLCAVCAALWRGLVTKRKRLEWSVSAAEPGESLLWMPGLLTGTILLAAASGWAGRVLGALWLLSPLLIRYLNRCPVREAVLPAEDREWLLEQASRIWRYFDEHLQPEDHDLPPDHVQESPDTGAARRTSPTNIGLALLAPMAAADLGLLSREAAAERIARQLEAVEGLEKYRGHFYNWYSTASARPIPPAYISTVDSGNLCGDLIALRQGLLDWGEEFLAARAGALADAMRFDWLYDAERQLFRIGYDVGEEKFTENWYDLLASEARQTSFLAVARGEVPAEHWKRLSRSLTRLGRRFGLVSWGGTAFEYLMPHLLMPAPRGSLLRESLLLCVEAQRRWGREQGLPWGVSESAYFMVDGGGTYQYAAHGVPPLGLCPGLGQERVAAPYASFLSLELAPEAALENLKRLEALGVSGKYGFCEAVDFSPERTEEEPAVLRSWMAHHLGMSLAAIDNLLCGSVWRKRFFREPELAACAELLEEQMPLGLPLRRSKTIRGKSMKQNELIWRTGTGHDPEHPVFHLLAADTLRCAVRGDGDFSLCREELILAESLRCEFQAEGRVWRLFPAESEGVALKWAFTPGESRHILRRGGVKAELQLRLEANGLLLRWSAESEKEGELELSLLPVLAERDAYEAHRAFSRISVESRAEGESLLFLRRPSGERHYPALAARVSGEGRLTATENNVLRLRVAVHPGENGFRLALGWGEEKRDALLSAEALLLGAGCAAPELPALTEEEAWREDALLSALLAPEENEERPAGQSTLWAYGVSGDLPLWAMPCAPESAWKPEEAVTLWDSLRRKGFRSDLVFLTPGNGCWEAICRLLERWELTGALGEKGGVHLAEDTPESRRVFRGMAELWCVPPKIDRNAQGEPPAPKLAVQTGPVRFCWEGDVFRFRTGGGLPPRRWSQILTNGRFGWTADDCGTGHLWSGNAHENKLTPWLNDPYAHAGPEQLFLEEEGKKTSLFAAADGIDTEICYGPGCASWEKRWDSIRVKLTAFVPMGERRRIFLLTASGCPRDARVLWTFRPQMGAKERDARFVRVRAEDGCIFAENPANGQFPGETLCLSGSEALTLERRGRDGLTLSVPMGSELVLSAGVEDTAAPAAERARSLLRDTIACWQEQAGFLRVRTPEPALNYYLSFWGRYQTIACRLMARTALYQCGGAYGFRDQLQDVCGLLPNGKELAREQILRCCRHQYEEGDVMHWWHETAAGEQGVRTEISDDLMWLSWALCRWTEVTGDKSLLEEPCGYLTSPPLKRGERTRYEAAERSALTEPALRHGVRAIECCLGRGSGEHGLLLMGSGDWNDGMDGIGEAGRGESVWLTWFVSLVLERFAPLCGGVTRVRYERLARSLAEKANAAWDGGWYLRAYDDNGCPVGSRENETCQIDSIAQSFSVFAPNPGKDRAAIAVQNAVSRLYDPAAGTIALLTPPFAPGSGAGYLAAYPGGVRENGGQYTHAAVWLAMACFRLGNTEQGWELLRTLLPETHSNKVYQGEPYVLAGDVSTAPGKEGRCGWSWYTGAASWFCRAAQEELLGLRVRDGALSVEPNLPQSWPGYEAEWTLEGKHLRIRVKRGERPETTLNGVPAEQPMPLASLPEEAELCVTVARSGKTG